MTGELWGEMDMLTELGHLAGRLGYAEGALIKSEASADFAGWQARCASAEAVLRIVERVGSTMAAKPDDAAKDLAAATTEADAHFRRFDPGAPRPVYDPSMVGALCRLLAELRRPTAHPVNHLSQCGDMVAGMIAALHGAANPSEQEKAPDA